MPKEPIEDKLIELVANALKPLLEAVYDVEKTKPEIVKIIDQTILTIIQTLRESIEEEAYERGRENYRKEISRFFEILMKQKPTGLIELLQAKTEGEKMIRAKVLDEAIEEVRKMELASKFMGTVDKEKVVKVLQSLKHK